MMEETSKIKKEYERSFTTDPFGEETIMMGETLKIEMTDGMSLKITDMTKNSKKA